jgi:DEAD/DEAH box helicase domain-containing protein
MPRPWRDASSGPPPPLADFVRTVIEDRALRGSVAWSGHVPGAGAQWDDSARIPPDLEGALASAGVRRLWTHQGRALAALKAGEHVLSVTPTASGKSLVYMLPTLERLAADPTARALYLFPYKALEQDQMASLEGLLRAAGLDERIQAAIYDGDTSPADRRRLRASPPQVLITNPDMLHMGLLAYHEEWRALFSRLELVVVDELHVYRGIFGTHMHHVMRRLARVCRHHGSTPRFIASSATIGNPAEFASSLLGVPVTVVDASGAPRGGRHFVFVNPGSGSPYTMALWLLERCVRAGYRTIAFTKARRITELLASWISATAPDLASRIASYRAGYLPSERRAIERRLADGQLAGVISTSALEHGIDIGGLDVCILVGYPGSITSSWQRLGRVGRKGSEALVFMVALPDALDQYFMTHPREFFERGFERAAADPSNPIIAAQHLVCAGAEIPLGDEDRSLYGDSFDLVETLAATGGGLVQDASGTSWYSLRRAPPRAPARPPPPPRDVSLRSIGAGYDIVDAATERPIGSVDGVRAFLECHPGAIYLHQGQQHEVVELDRDRRRVVARRVAVDHYTQVRSEKETEILEVLERRDLAGYRAGLGRLRVTQEFKEYVRKRLADQQPLSAHPLDLPPLIYETVGLWWEVPEAARDEAAAIGFHFMGSLHASEHAAISLFPLLMLCDRGDLGGISYPHHPQIAGPAVFLYDGYPGGIGLAARAFDLIETLLSDTRALITSCACELGCPSCVHSPRCGSGNHPLDKAGAGHLLAALIEGRHPLAAARPIPRAAPAPAPRPDATMAAGPAPAAGRRTEPPHQAPAISAGPLSGRVLFFDLETRRSAEEVGGWAKIHAMGLALAVVYDEQENAFRTYHEQDVDRLLVDLLSADRVIGFNVKRFDYVVLQGYRQAAFERIPTCDMMEELHRVLGFRVSLGRLAQATLGEGKSADGLQSLAWFREGRLDLIEQYCRKDVDVTRRLYHFGRDRGYVLFRDAKLMREMRVPVSW